MSTLLGVYEHWQGKVTTLLGVYEHWPEKVVTLRGVFEGEVHQLAILLNGILECITFTRCF